MFLLTFRARTHPRGHTADPSPVRLRQRQALIYYGLCTAKESFGLTDIISYRCLANPSIFIGSKSHWIFSAKEVNLGQVLG